MAEVVAARPEWTEVLYRAKGGRDHLGLVDVASTEFMAALSPSVNALTFHPRYHSFYAFLVDEFWRRDELPRTPSAFRDFFRPRDWAFSLAAQFCRAHEGFGMFGIVGSGTTEPLANKDQGSYVYQPDYIKSSLGGYGLYYATVIAELGFIYPGGIGLPYAVDVASERGRELAEAFRQEIAETAYYQEYFDDPLAEIPATVLEEYAAKGCLCQVRNEQAADRAILLDAFLHGGGQGRDRSRRDSLRLFLDIAHQTHGQRLDPLLFRELLFFGRASNGATYDPIESLVAHHRRWRYFQAREYYVFALNGLWSHLCAWGRAQGADDPLVPVDELWRHLDRALGFERLAELLDLPDPELGPRSRFDELLAWLLSLVESKPEAFDRACGLAAPLQEAALYRLARDQWQEEAVEVAGMLCLLALTYLRFSPAALRAEEEWRFACFGEPDRLSLARYVAEMGRTLSDPDVTIADVVHWLTEEYIIRQHQLVAYRKLPDDTFRFRYEDGGLRFFSDPALSIDFGFADPRFAAMGTTVHELGLCGSLYQDEHGLTRDGEQLLEQGDL